MVRFPDNMCLIQQPSEMVAVHKCMEAWPVICDKVAV